MSSLGVTMGVTLKCIQKAPECAASVMEDHCWAPCPPAPTVQTASAALGRLWTGVKEQ